MERKALLCPSPLTKLLNLSDAKFLSGEGETITTVPKAVVSVIFMKKFNGIPNTVAVHMSWHPLVQPDFQLQNFRPRF